MEQTYNLSTLAGIKHAFYNAKDFQNAERPVLMTQVHSADVLVLDEYTDTMPAVDALVTKCPNINLTVKTADCAPVLLADDIHGVIGAVHAGWKGAFQGIIENTILKMLELGANLKHIHAAIGPCLHLESFEVSDDFKALFPRTEYHFFIQKDGKECFDFLAYVKHRIRRVGIQSVEAIDIDTYTSSDYFSYRREPENPGRQYSCIQIVK
ncbi:MAG: peptidoglycan editing factor PgeF [Alphaproteobacteria bacterium]|nr:peptidoglycan editing factor PgeF [Alphaproteobacteria bacterium]